MSTFAIVLHPGGRPAAAEALEALLAPVAYLGSLGRSVWTSDSLSFAALLHSVTPERQFERQPVVSKDGRYLAAADVRLDNRRALLDATLKNDADPAETTDTELLLASYLRWGTDCPAHLVGDFAFVVYDFLEQSLFAAVDPLGVRRLFFATLPTGRFLIASEEALLLQFEDLTAHWNELAVAKWLLARPDREQSLFSAVGVLAGGRQMHWTRARYRVTRWWSPVPEREIRYRKSEDYAAHYLEVMRSVVRDRTRSASRIVASELSGGIDSSSVCALMPEQDVARSFSITQLFPGFGGCDEGRYISEIAGLTGVESLTFDASDIIARAFPLGYMPRPESPAAFDNPVQQRTLQIAAANGADVLLTGDGGDAMLWGSATTVYAERLLQGDVQVIRELLLAASERGASRGRWLALALLRPLVRIFAPQLPWRKRGLRNLSPLPSWMDADADLRARIEEDTLARGEPGLGPESRRALWKNLNNVSTLSLLEAYRLNGRAMGVEVRAPFFDVRVAEFVLSIPPGLLHRHGYPKWLARIAMRGRLPDSVLWRKEKTVFSGVFHDAWRKHRDQVASMLTGEILDRVPLVDGPRLVRYLFNDGDDGYTSPTRSIYYLMALAVWLDRRNVPRNQVKE
jgi:asparagine synthase (glutamine-hydrolysing)